MNFNNLIDGWNLAFALPLLLALVYLGLYIASGVTFGDPDTDGDADHDADHHHPDPAHAGGHDVIQYHASQPTDAPVTFSLLSWFGVGRVPISLWLSGAMLGWGALGLGASAFANKEGFNGPTTAAIDFGAAALGALIVMRALTLLVTRIAPIHESYARRRHELLGSEGEAIYAIDESFGMVGVRDSRGEFFQLGCRVDDGQPIAKGSRVKLVGYNRDTNLFHVVPVETPADTVSAA
ncbi:MAG TPA: hypothetical protein VGN72_18825 [Tepidisphaeraceae bacterium]|jgi:hypothetical protein|nr:hypothetical protein [Tepidisphaeraceae bacterium]